VGVRWRRHSNVSEIVVWQKPSPLIVTVWSACGTVFLACEELHRVSLAIESESFWHPRHGEFFHASDSIRTPRLPDFTRRGET